MHIKTRKEFSQSPEQDNGEGGKSSSYRDSPKSCSVRSEKSMIQYPPSTGQDSHSKCLTLMKDQEELKTITTSHRTQKCHEQRQTKSTSPVRKWAGVKLDKPISKSQNIPLRQKAQRSNNQAKQVSEYRRGCYFGNTSSPMESFLTSSSPYFHWDISPVTSPSDQAPALGLSEGNTSHRMLPDTPHRGLEAVEDSVAEDFSHSPVTQCTSLSIFSHHRNSPSGCESDKSKAEVKCPKKSTDRVQGKKTHQNQGAFEITQHSAAERVIEASSDGHFPKLGNNLGHTFTGCSAITYDDQKCGSKHKTRDKSSSSSLQPEKEKEGIRACSRKSENCVFNVSSNYMSSLPLLENEVESAQSNLAIGLSESMKANIVSQTDQMSLLQPSTILEYLSLPGFVEMSVDEPTEECQLAESTWLNTREADVTVLRGEPDVVPKNWENQGHYHLKESRFLMDLNMPTIPVEGSISKNAGSSKSCLQLAQENTSIHSKSSETKCISTQYLPCKERPSQTLFSHKSLGSEKPTHLRPVQPLVSTKVVHEIPYQGESIKKPLLEHTQWCQPQYKGTNQVSTRTSQAPVHFMKKSVSIGQCRTFSSIGQPRPLLRKSISLGSQKWEPHLRNSYASNNCYKDEVPHLSVKDQCYNLGGIPVHSYLKSGPSWQGTGHAKSYSSHGRPERPCHSERPYITPSSFIHAREPSVLEPPKIIESDEQESDPCPLSYQESLRLVQHRYVPQGPPRPLIAPRLVLRWDHPHPMDSRRSFQRQFLPRGYSWPSPHQGVFPLGEVQREPYGVGMGTGRESTGEGGRASYASQSSGRGSVGTFGHLRQSVSITPTLLSSPETTEEREKRESNMRGSRTKR